MWPKRWPPGNSACFVDFSGGLVVGIRETALVDYRAPAWLDNCKFSDGVWIHLTYKHQQLNLAATRSWAAPASRGGAARNSQLPSQYDWSCLNTAKLDKTPTRVGPLASGSLVESSPQYSDFLPFSCPIILVKLSFPKCSHTPPLPPPPHPTQCNVRAKGSSCLRVGSGGYTLNSC